MNIITKYKFIGALVLFHFASAYAQEGIGIGTTYPKSILDIVSNDPSKGGVLIPRYNADDFLNLTFTDEQNSMLVFVTSGVSTPNTGITEFMNSEGYYYYNANLMKFIKLTESSAITNSAWSLNGNTVTSQQFLGTLNNLPLKFKVNNIVSGYVSPLNISFGQNSLGNANEAGGAKNNVGLGFNTLRSLTTGDDNTAIGENALESVTTGTDNVALGQGALKTITTARYNIAIGGRIMENTTADIRQNIGIGYDILNRANAGFNVAIGYQALKASVGGSDNVVIGRSASTKLISGSSNVTLGRESLENATSGNNNVTIGTKAGENIVESNENVLIGNETGAKIQSGNENIFIGHRAGNTVLDDLTGSNNIVIGTSTAPSSATVSNEVTLGSNIITNYRMWTNGWTTVSDRSYKNTIANLPVGLSFVKSLRPVEYIYNNETNKTKSFGFIAQEVNDLIKKSNLNNIGLVQQFDEKTLGLRMNDFIAILTKAIQEQQTVIEKQQTELDSLKKEIDEIKKLLLNK